VPQPSGGIEVSEQKGYGKMSRPLNKLSLVSKTIVIITVLCPTFWFCSENRFGFANDISDIAEQPDGWFKGNEVTVKKVLPNKDASLT